VAQHRADGHGFSSQNGKENPTPFGMMPVTTQQILKPGISLEVPPYYLIFLAVVLRLLVILAVAQSMCAQMD